MKPKVATISLDNLISTGNVRNVEHDPELMGLAASMQDNGQKVPIQVYSAGGDTYFVKYGHRRVVAAHINQWDTITAIIENPPTDEADLLVSQYTENEYREGMSYLDKARVYARMKELGISQKEIGLRFGKGDTEVSLSLAMLRANPKLQEAVEAGLVKPSAIEPLLSQSLEVQEALAEKAIREKTVRKVAALVKASQIKSSALTSQAQESSEGSYDTDPLEVMALTELQEAVTHLQNVEETGITHPELCRRARPAVAELLRLAKSLTQNVN